MRSAGNFSPEWGYLAPAPSFLRTARIVLVATAVGATAGAGVVLALIDRPAAEADTTSVAVQAAPVSAVPPTAAAAASPVAPVNVTTAVPAQSTASVVPQPPPTMPAQSTARVAPQPPPAMPAQSTASVAQQPPVLNAPAEKSGAAPILASKPAPGVAALSEAPPATVEATPTDAPDGTLIPPETVPPEKKTKHHVAVPYAWDNRPANLGTALRRLFSAHSGTSYYPNRGL